jgi:NAD(P) transhydrogenase subunit beta
MDQAQTVVAPLLYLISSVLFVLGLKDLTRVRTARRGNTVSAVAMLVAIVGTLIELGTFDYKWIVLGIVIGSVIGWIAAVRVEMTSMPEMVALFNGFGGLASLLVGASVIWLEVVEVNPGKTVFEVLASHSNTINTTLAILIGGVTLSGSVVAYAKLAGRMTGNPILLPGRHVVNALLILGSLGAGFYSVYAVHDPLTIEILTVVVALLAVVLGVMLVIPIGGADMPVVIALLNSYSGLAGSATGFVLDNNVLIISGALVGASGIILTKVMCDAMNRTFMSVLLGGFGGDAAAASAGAGSNEYGPVRKGGSEEAAMVLEAAETVIFVPGYGLAVSQAQHTTRELADLLQKRGAKVLYAIHPVAGRMPGHMNVLLAEADVPYDQLIEMEQINPEFKNTDVVVVLGANDVVNPAAEKTPGSPIYGMPVLPVWNARSVIVVKRSLSPGFAGIKNELFEYPGTMMIFEDAKKALQGMISELKQL